VVHIAIATVVYVYTHEDLALMSPTLAFDVMMHVVYCSVIDGILVLLSVDRASVRQWHWKVNTITLIFLLIMVFSDHKVKYLVCLLLPLVSLVFYWFREKRSIYLIGLAKYTKSGNEENYESISSERNVKYFVVTMLEVIYIWQGKMRGSLFFLSPLLFVLVDAVLNKLTNTSRTKFSDLYVSIFSASMDTGLWLSLFSVKFTSGIFVSLCSISAYLLYLHWFAMMNSNSVILETYAVINNPTRWALFGAYVLISQLFHPYQNHVLVVFANLLNNGCFIFMSYDILYKFAWYNNFLHAVRNIFCYSRPWRCLLRVSYVDK